MASSRARKQEASDGLMRSSYDTIRDVELVYGVVVEVALAPQVVRKGVWVLVLTAVGRRQDDGDRAVAVYRREYPNADLGTLEGQLFSGLNRLATQLGDAGRATDAETGF